MKQKSMPLELIEKNRIPSCKDREPRICDKCLYSKESSLNYNINTYNYLCNACSSEFEREVDKALRRIEKRYDYKDGKPRIYE